MNIVFLTDEEIAAENNRSKGPQSVYPAMLAEILANEGCALDKSWGIRFNVPGKTAASVSVGFNNAAAKIAKSDERYSGLKCRKVSKSENEEVTLTNTPTK